MALRYVLDENLRGPLWWAFQQHNTRGVDPVDVVRVGDPPSLPLGTSDPDLLIGAEREGRVLISVDWSTMPGHFADHLQQGHHSPGMFLLRPNFMVAELLSYLVLAAYVFDPAELQDQFLHVP